MEKKSAELKSRVTPEFKAEVEEKAKRAGMSTSDYIRIACGANSKIVILEDGKLIAQKLCESCALLESGTDSRQDMAQLSALLGDIYKVFNNVYDRLPEVLLDEKEEEDPPCQA